LAGNLPFALLLFAKSGLLFFNLLVHHTGSIFRRTSPVRIKRSTAPRPLPPSNKSVPCVPGHGRRRLQNQIGENEFCAQPGAGYGHPSGEAEVSEDPGRPARLAALYGSLASADPGTVPSRHPGPRNPAIPVSPARPANPTRREVACKLLEEP
jgi:hypothetical protein